MQTLTELNIPFWAWLIVGLVPHKYKHTHLRGGHRRWETTALFWSLTVYKRQSGKTDWTFSSALIETVTDVVWAVIEELMKRK